jgi:hypothetical protein
MKLVKVDHIRCAEWSGSTYVWAPNEWDEEQIENAVRTARQDYLDALNLARENQQPPNDYRYGPPPFAKYPDKKVSEVIEEWEAKKAEYSAWEKEQAKTKRSFMNFLALQGFTWLGSNEDDVIEVDVDWGHMHGTRIDYGETESDPSKSPAKVAGGKDYDDDDFA